MSIDAERGPGPPVMSGSASPERNVGMPSLRSGARSADTCTMSREVEELEARIRELEFENIALMRQHAETIVRERWIRDASSWIRERLDVETVTNRAVSELGPMLDVDQVVLRLREGSEWPLAASWCREELDDHEEPGGLAIPQSFLGAVETAYADRMMVVVPDLLADSRFMLDGPSLVRALGARAVVLVPLAQDDQSLGHISLYMVDSPRDWTTSDLALIEALGQEISSALAHARAYELARWVVVQLDELDRDKTDFLSSVSHELRTPLTSITGYIEMLADGDAGELTTEQLAMLGIIDRNSRRLLMMIEDLLTVSRIEAKTFELMVTPVDVGLLVDHVRDAVAPSVAERTLQLVIDVPEDLPELEGDAGQLERVLLNLATNAVKFTPPDGEVAIRARRHDDELVVSVSDTGIGIPLVEQPRLFHRFFRASTARDHAIQGTGLGLSLVKAVVERHGGTVTLESVPAEGTTVTVRLPLTQERIETGAPPDRGDTGPAANRSDPPFIRRRIDPPSPQAMTTQDRFDQSLEDVSR